MIRFFLIIYFCSLLASINSLSQQCANLTLCGSHGKCSNGNCLCDLYYYGMNCENEVNATSRVSFMNSGIQQNVIPIFVTTFIFGLPLLFAFGFICLDKIMKSKTCETFKSPPSLIPNPVLGSLEMANTNKQNNNNGDQNDQEAQNLIDLINISSPEGGNKNTIVKKNSFQEKKINSIEKNSSIIVKKRNIIEKKSNIIEKKNSITEKKSNIIDKNHERKSLRENHSGIPSILHREISQEHKKNDSKKLPTIEPGYYFLNKKKNLFLEDENQRIEETDEKESSESPGLSKFKHKAIVRTFYSREAEKFVREKDSISDVLEFLENNLQDHIDE